MKTSKRLEELAVDANPILSAVIGGSARNIFLKADAVVFSTTRFNLLEVEKYLPHLAEKKELRVDELYLALAMLPLTVYEEPFYRAKLSKARTLLSHRDPDDAHLLALAMKLGCPIWSNDKDFEKLGMDVYTTLDLLKKPS